MEVTKENFKQALPEVVAAIRECDFVALDTEFTGLSLSKSLDTSVIDTKEEQYQKLKQTAENFVVTQYGLSTFRYSSEEKRFVAKTWNFYIFPRPFEYVDRRFRCQASSLEFLSCHGFDFNKWIHGGVPFLRSAVADKLKPRLLEQIQKMEERNQQRREEREAARSGLQPSNTASNSVVLTSERDITFRNGIVEQIEEWLKQGHDQPLILTASNSFLRRVVYELIANNYPDLFVASLKSEEGSPQQWDKLQVTFVSEEERLLKEEQQIRELIDKHETAVGFTTVIRAIIEAAKPIVGHNLLLDLLYTYDLFIDGLPSDLATFKKELHKLFPVILDTKHLANVHPKFTSSPASASSSTTSTLRQEAGGMLFLSTALGDLFEATLKKKPGEEDEGSVEVVHEEGFTRYAFAAASSEGGEEQHFAHEAGYDAFMTGAVFVRLLAMILGQEKLLLEQNEEEEVERLRLNIVAAELKEYVNVLNLVRSFSPVTLDPQREDKEDRTFLFHVSFLSETQTSDIYQVFEGIPIQVKWIDSNNAVVAVTDLSFVPKVRAELVSGHPQSTRAQRTMKLLNFQIEDYESFTTAQRLRNNSLLRRSKRWLSSGGSGPTLLLAATVAATSSLATLAWLKYHPRS
ncbi:poly(A)-specific ribonuclease PNLDC1 isoform X2 [Balamuthia mandrillaris]